MACHGVVSDAAMFLIVCSYLYSPTYLPAFPRQQRCPTGKPRRHPKHHQQGEISWGSLILIIYYRRSKVCVLSI